MQYKEFKDGIKLSRLGMGIMRLPVIDGDNSRIDYPEAKKIIELAYQKGVNYYDTAYIYHEGKSEEFAGKALAEYPRDSFYIADKFNYQAEPDFRKQFAQQLENLKMDHIDFYLLHGIQDNFVDDILNCGAIEYFDNLKKEGAIRYFGFSYHGSEENLLKVLSSYQWDFAQIQLNYYDWEFGNQRRLYELLTDANIPAMIMEPVHGGMLAKMNEDSSKLLKAAKPDASLASWAMRWIKGLDNVQVVLSGMSDLSQVEDNVNTFSNDVPLDETEKDLLKQAASLLRKYIALPCTSCRYCVPDCPMELHIPDLLRAYNEMKAGGEWRLADLFGLNESEQPGACIGCGNCTAHCPQSLPIPDAMSEMASVMSKMGA